MLCFISVHYKNRQDELGEGDISEFRKAYYCITMDRNHSSDSMAPMGCHLDKMEVAGLRPSTYFSLSNSAFQWLMSAAICHL